MNWKKKLITYGVLLAVALVILLAVVSLEWNSQESGAAMTMQYLSDGFFTVSALYIGCAILMMIQDAGNFYGIQFLFYTLTHRFSLQKERRDERKTYFAYCQDKMERAAAEEKSPIKSAMLLVGLGALALSVLFAMLFYRFL